MFSKTLTRAPGGTWSEGYIISGDVVDRVADLKTQPGKNILLSGSLSIVRSLAASDAVDDYRLILCPVLLGKGVRLFEDLGAEMRLKLVDANSLNRGSDFANIERYKEFEISPQRREGIFHQHPPGRLIER